MEPGEIGPVSAPAEFFQNPWVPKAECCFSAAPHPPSPFGCRFAYSDYGLPPPEFSSHAPVQSHIDQERVWSRRASRNLAMWSGSSHSCILQPLYPCKYPCIDVLHRRSRRGCVLS